jgi:hypothetical protein
VAISPSAFIFTGTGVARRALREDAHRFAASGLDPRRHPGALAAMSLMPQPATQIQVSPPNASTTKPHRSAQPHGPLTSPKLKSVMHATSSPHAPRFQFLRPPFPISVSCDTVTHLSEPGPRQRRFIVVLYSPDMATKTRTKKRKATLDSVLSTVERGFADLEGKMDRGFAAVADDITDIKSKMATKDDIADVKSTLADHTKILNDHTRDLAIIKKDFTTNLDKRLQLAVRVSEIEKHLGLDKKIAA